MVNANVCEPAGASVPENTCVLATEVIGSCVTWDGTVVRSEHADAVNRMQKNVRVRAARIISDG